MEIIISLASQVVSVTKTFVPNFSLAGRRTMRVIPSEARNLLFVCVEQLVFILRCPFRIRNFFIPKNKKPTRLASGLKTFR